MSRKPVGQGEVFERGPDGKPTDARLWHAMLDGDTKDVLDGRDPEAIRQRLVEQERLEELDASWRREQTDAPHVLFLRTTKHGQEPAGRAVLTEGRVVFEGVAAELVQEMERGIRVGRRTLRPADGVAFLRVLPTHYTGSFYRAKYVGPRRNPRKPHRPSEDRDG